MVIETTKNLGYKDVLFLLAMKVLEKEKPERKNRGFTTKEIKKMAGYIDGQVNCLWVAYQAFVDFFLSNEV